PGFVRPGVTVDAKPEPAELTEHRRPVRFGIRCARPGINVNVMYIADLHIVPAARAIDQPARIILLDQAGETRGVELAPALVEDDPHDDARMVVQPVEHAPQFELELPGRFGGAGDLPLTGRYASIAAGHVLPDQEPQLIAPVIPALRLHFDMLAG